MDVAKVFVYGTLKKGQPNYKVACQAGSHTVTRGELSGFRLYDLGPYPAVLEGEGTAYGQLLDYGRGVDKALVVLDRLEDFDGPGNPNNYYNRVLATAVTSDLKQTFVRCWVYTFNRPLGAAKLLPKGVWPEN